MTALYEIWNRRLLEYCRDHAVDGERRVFLVTEPFLETQDAEDEAVFLGEVREAFRIARCRSPHDPLHAFLQTDAGTGEPLCAALLAVTVLAAGAMKNLKYYEWLDKYLHISGSSGYFGNPVVEELWQLLKRYFAGHGLRLSEPGVTQQHIRLPKHHALLRQMDMRKLAHFFYQHDLKPHVRYSPEQIRHHLNNWLPESGFTPCGREAWRDEVRSPAVLVQVQEALAGWNRAEYLDWRGRRGGGGDVVATTRNGGGSGSGESAETEE